MVGDGVVRLREAGLRVTPQRLAVLDALSRRSHPTADDIYRDIAPVYPGLGLATVYNTLSALAARGQVLVVDDRGGRRYDLHVTPHQHIRCRRCGMLADLPHWNDRQWIDGATPAGWAVERWTLMADGLCPDCQSATPATPDEHDRN
jgi:Fe2+ or Zn2+ uptake regulation protein